MTTASTHYRREAETIARARARAPRSVKLAEQLFALRDRVSPDLRSAVEDLAINVDGWAQAGLDATEDDHTRVIAVLSGILNGSAR